MLLKEQQVQYYGFSTPLHGVLKVSSGWVWADSNLINKKGGTNIANLVCGILDVGCGNIYIIILSLYSHTPCTSTMLQRVQEK